MNKHVYVEKLDDLYIVGHNTRGYHYIKRTYSSICIECKTEDDVRYTTNFFADEGWHDYNGSSTLMNVEEDMLRSLRRSNYTIPVYLKVNISKNHGVIFIDAMSVNEYYLIMRASVLREYNGDLN